VTLSAVSEELHARVAIEHDAAGPIALGALIAPVDVRLGRSRHRPGGPVLPIPIAFEHGDIVDAGGVLRSGRRSRVDRDIAWSDGYGFGF
jgi:hypothetical protein